jgi:zinc-ribbon domain
MSEPEISRRCLSCGASVRQRAAFCPQCGHELDQQETGENDQQMHLTDRETMLDEGTVTEPDNDGSLPPEHQTITEPLIVRRRDSSPEQTQADEARTQPLIVNSTRVLEKRSRIPDDSRDLPTNQQKQTARQGAARRAVIEDQVLGRVERLRKASSVMIDQAAYDPSMRFLLVAAVLFVIFVVLMVLSKVIG